MSIGELSGNSDEMLGVGGGGVMVLPDDSFVYVAMDQI